MPVLTVECHAVVVNHVSLLVFDPSLGAIGVCRKDDWSSCNSCHIRLQTSVLN